jgi:hypothetical protein
LSGEKWQMQLLADMHVGNDKPFFMFFSFLNTLPVSSNIRLSPCSQMSFADAPATHFSTISLRTPETQITHRTNRRSRQISKANILTVRYFGGHLVLCDNDIVGDRCWRFLWLLFRVLFFIATHSTIVGHILFVAEI